MEVKKEESKGKSVQGFGSMIVAISAIIATGVFIAACVIANDMYYGEGAVIAIGLAIALIVVLIGKFMGDVLGCMGEMAEDMRWTKNIIEAKAMIDGGIEIKEEEEPSRYPAPCFVDWLMGSLDRPEYAKSFKDGGIREYQEFMELTKDDMKRLGVKDEDLERIVRVQGKMKISG